MCVPVYRPGALLVDTLSSIRAQCYRQFQVVISIDGDDGDSESRCEQFVGDPRFRLIVQPRRLGWVKNVNALLIEVDTELFCLHPHDDLMHQAYLERLCAHLDRTPRAVTAFSDIRMQGELNGRAVSDLLRQSSIVGAPVERQRRLLKAHFNAVAWRGLTLTRALRETGPMRTNRVDNFAEDTVWMAQLARAGELHRVPEELYVKRYHDRMTHTQWRAWPLKKRRWAWLVHCHEMLTEALRVAPSSIERLMLARAALSRLRNFDGQFEGDGSLES